MVINEVLEVAKRLREALDIERVTRKFYDEFRAQHVAFIELIDGIANGAAREIIHTLDMEPEYTNLRKYLPGVLE